MKIDYMEKLIREKFKERLKTKLEKDLDINNPYNNEGKKSMKVVPCPWPYYPNSWPPKVEDYPCISPFDTPAEPGQILVSDGTGWKAQWKDTPSEAQKTEELITIIKKETHASLTTLVETRIQILAEKAECSKLSSTSMDFSKYLTAKNEMEKLYDLFKDWITKQ